MLLLLAGGLEHNMLVIKAWGRQPLLILDLFPLSEDSHLAPVAFVASLHTLGSPLGRQGAQHCHLKPAMEVRHIVSAFLRLDDRIVYHNFTNTYHHFHGF